MKKSSTTGRSKRTPNKVTGTFADILEDKVKAEQQKSGRTQKEIAEGIGVTPSMLSSWMNDESTATIDSLVKIADYFDISTDELLGREKDYSNIVPDVGVVFQKTGLHLSAFDYIEAWSERQKSAFRLLLSSPEFPRFLEAVIRCGAAYQKEREIVLRAEAQRDPAQERDLLAGIPKEYQVEVAGIIFGYRSLCQYVMESADDEANLAIADLQESALAIGRSLVKKSKVRANKRSVEDWRREQADILSRLIESMRKEAPDNGNSNQA